MDAFELLKADHKKVADLFKQIENGSEQTKTRLFANLKNELDVHAHVEEVIFYPALENKQESRDITLEAYEEHKVVKDLLAELANGSPNDEWDAKLTVLKENVEHHVEEEEGELFSKARKVLSDDQIKTLGNEMEAEKARQQGVAAPAKSRARGGSEVSNRSRATPAKSKTKSKSKERPGVLKRLANLVGLGDSESADKRGRKPGKTMKAKSASKAPTKSGAGKKASKAVSRKTAKSNKKTGSKKSASNATKAPRRAGSKKSGGAKKMRAARKR